MISKYFIRGVLITSLSFIATANDEIQVDPNWSLIQPNECRFSGQFTQQKQLQGLDPLLHSDGIFFHDCNIGIIWKTLAPVNESLVIQKTGKAFSISNGASEQLKSMQSRQVNELIMALVAGDQQTLARLFEISAFDNGDIVLLPKNRRLQRAIEKITLSKSTEASLSAEGSSPAEGSAKNAEWMIMQMVDSNGQLTKINSIISQNHNDDPATVQSDCLQIGDFEIIDCGLLQAP